MRLQSACRPSLRARGTVVASFAGMNTSDVSTVARHLFQTQGTKAIAEAARQARSCTDAGDSERARFWSRVEAVLQEMRGPRQS